MSDEYGKSSATLQIGQYVAIINNAFIEKHGYYIVGRLVETKKGRLGFYVVEDAEGTRHESGDVALASTVLWKMREKIGRLKMENIALKEALKDFNDTHKSVMEKHSQTVDRIVAKNNKGYHDLIHGLINQLKELGIKAKAPAKPKENTSS